MTSLRGLERSEFPQAVRKAAFKRCCRNGVPHCETCDIEINARTGTIYEHVQADGLDGEPTLENCKVHCRNCAKAKDKIDNAIMAKADAVLKKEYGLGPSIRKPIRSAGFRKSSPQHSATRPLVRTR